MKKIMTILSLLVGSLTAHATMCPDYLSSKLSDAEILKKKISSFAANNIQISNCKAKVSGIINPNATEEGPADTYHMATTLSGIQTTSIFACDSVDTRGQSSTLFFKIIRFEPISEPRGDGFSSSSGATCIRPSLDSTSVETSSIKK